MNNVIFIVLIARDHSFRIVWSTRRECAVSLLDCQSWASGFKPRPGQKFGSRFLFLLRP